LEMEIGRNPDAGRCRDAAALLAFANEKAPSGFAAASRAVFLQGFGFGAFDALHLASAEQGQADVFLTTDDDLLRRARWYSGELRIRVWNPISWYREAIA